MASSSSSANRAKVFAVADKVPKSSRRYLTPKQRYPVRWDDGALFEIVDDEGDLIMCCWSWSAHLDGDNWQRVKSDN